MNFEQFPSQEKLPIQAEAVVESFRVNGKENPASIELLRDWVGQEQTILDGMDDGPERSRAVTVFMIQWATVYFEAGFLDDALEVFNSEEQDPRDSAVANGLHDLVEQIDILVEKIERQKEREKNGNFLRGV